MAKQSKVIIENKRFQLTIERLSYQIIENYNDFADTCIIGIQETGAIFAQKIYDQIKRHKKNAEIPFGKLDITFYRDDFRIRKKPLEASRTEIGFLVEDKKVILIDDVLYTGRTIQAALAAIQHYGRPRSVELVVLIDRRFNRHLPIKANYIGLMVDSLDEAYVEVVWDETGADRVILFPSKKK
ncbi:MAG TPA: bifunctional pyr operon transcriptional regulator/uracil phosphoribosyltransferase PyrR [Saprospiraceae bacterium]|nr:bifunctional pyr operon transcriptional regulator/uracil phosphoribosyltransferase PyrR [Saprospiraceae bacterium]